MVIYTNNVNISNKIHEAMNYVVISKHKRVNFYSLKIKNLVNYAPPVLKFYRSFTFLPMKKGPRKIALGFVPVSNTENKS